MRRIDWDEQYRLIAPKLKGICRRYVADSAIAEDLVQETFITAIEKIETYKAYGSFEGWIRKIAINKSLLYLKEHQLNELSLEMMKKWPHEQHDQIIPMNKVRRTIESACFSAGELLQILDQLPVHHKTVFNLYVLDGYKHQQIAQILNISTNTSKSHLSRARKKAQEILYQQAIQKDDATIKRRSSLFILLFASRPVDRIFRQGFRNYQSVAGNMTILAKSVSTIKTGFTIGKAVLLGTFAVATVSTLIVLDHGKIKVVESDDQVIEVTEPERLTEPAFTIDSTAENVQEVQPEVEDTKPAIPVVIRKKIVVHDTIRLQKSASK